MTRIAGKTGIYFGAATLYGLAGWLVIGGAYPIWIDGAFIALGAVLFFFLDSLIGLLDRKRLSCLGAIGFSIAALFAIGFGVKLWSDLGL